MLNGRGMENGQLVLGEDDRPICALIGVILPSMPEAEVVGGLIERRRADSEAIEVLWIALSFHEGLQAAARAAGHIGVLRPLTVEGLDDALECHRGQVLAQIAADDAALRPNAPLACGRVGHVAGGAPACNNSKLAIKGGHASTGTLDAFATLC